MKYALNYRHQHQPMEDHSFVDDGQLITAKTLKGLVVAVREYRERNFHPAGDPEQEIATYYLLKYPWLVAALKDPSEAPLGAQESTGGAAAKEAVEQFVRAVWRDPPKRLLTQEEREVRAQACRECPFNAPVDLSGDREVVRRKYLLARGETPEGCGWCEFHRWHAGLAACIPDVIKLARPEPPEECWAGQEAKKK
jgi:hypothetical protein